VWNTYSFEDNRNSCSKWTNNYSQSVDQDKWMDRDLLPISGPRQADGERDILYQWTKTSWLTKNYPLSVDQDKLMDKELLSISGPVQVDRTKYRQQAILIPTYCRKKLTLTLQAFQWTASPLWSGLCSTLKISALPHTLTFLLPFRHSVPDMLQREKSNPLNQHFSAHC